MHSLFYNINLTFFTVGSDIHDFIHKYPEILNDMPKKKKIQLIRTKIMNLRRRAREKYQRHMKKFLA
jgi:hypothetical protein